MLLTFLQDRHDLPRLTFGAERVAYALCVGRRAVRSGIHIQHQPGTLLLLCHAVELKRCKWFHKRIKSIFYVCCRTAEQAGYGTAQISVTVAIHAPLRRHATELKHHLN
jgi:glycine cleavage system regulatory protein